CKGAIEAPSAAPQEPLPTFFEDQEAEAAQPVARRHVASSRKAQKQSNQIPLLIGGGAMAAVLLVGLIIWLVTRNAGPKMDATSVTQVNSSAPQSPATATSPLATPSVSALRPSGPTAADLVGFMPVDSEALALIRVAESLKAEDHESVKSQLESTLHPVLARTGIGLDQLQEVMLSS